MWRKNNGCLKRKGIFCWEKVFLKKEMEDRIMIKLNGGSDGACKEIF